MRAAMRDPRAYLTVGVLGIVLILLLGAVATDVVVGPVYLTEAVAIVTVIVMGVMWALCRTDHRVTRAQAVFLAAGFVAWVLSVLQVLLAGLPMRPEALIMGALLGLALVRPPDRASAVWLIDLLAISLAVVCLVLVILESNQVLPSWYARIADPVGAHGLQVYEIQSYWTPLRDILGLDGRWAGPFDHPGRAGQAGALILVWGLTRRGGLRVALVGSGLLFVLLAGSNTAYLSVAVGLTVLIAVAALQRLGRLPRWGILALVLGSLAAAALLFLVVVGPNPGLSGRTTVWPVYWDLWTTSPLTGVGDAAIAQAQQAELLPSWAYHAHNSWLDLLARRGIVVLALSVAAIAAALTVAVRSARLREPGPLALIVVVLVASITQPMVLWLLPTIPMVMVVLAVLASATPDRDAPAADRSRALDRPSTDDRASRAASSGAAGPS